jgi:class 3 adenylate cyclase/tetratricopeptide (TPR) repeat protein
MICAACGHENRDGARFCDGCGTPLVAPEVGRREERKVVTIVFADLAGSTGLGERLDPEALRDVQTRYFEAMRASLERHGGTVEKYIGDAVMAVFGVPVLHEDDALRAVRAAVEMRDGMAALNSRLRADLGIGLTVRIGVNSGEVAAGDIAAGHGMVAGDAVNTAARLQSAAPPGEILIGPHTRSLVGQAVRLRTHPSAQLPGKKRPLRVWQVVGLAETGGRFQRPRDVPLVGRRAELRMLRARLKRCRERRRCVLVTVTGPAGIGKSRLLREFLEAAEREATVVVGRCLPYGDGITYWPLTEVANELAGGDGVPGITSVLDDEPDAGTIAAQIGVVAGWQDATSTAPGPQWAVRRLFEALAQSRPLVVMFDDIHWAERAMLDLIEQVAARATAAILIVCSSRGELFERRPGWERAGGARSVIRLAPLTDAESALLLGRLAARRRARVSRSELMSAAEGNPLFLEQLVAMRADAPASRTPPTIHALLAARIDVLPVAERRALDAASIEGRGFHRGAVRALSDGGDEVDAALVGLVQRELIQPGRSEFADEAGYRFSHILVRDAAYELLSKRRRAELHVAYVRWLFTRYDPGPAADEIAGHHLEQAHRYHSQLSRADSADAQRLAAEASRHLSQAGRRAVTAGNRAGAVNLLNRALALQSPGAGDRLRILIDLGTVLREQGQFRESESYLRQAWRSAKARSDDSLAARAQVERLLTRLQVDPDGVARQTKRLGPALEPQLEAAADHAGLARLWHLRGMLWWIQERSAYAERAWQRAATEAETASDARVVHDAVGWEAASVALGPTPVPRAIARCRQICRILIDDPWAHALALQPLASLHAMRGEFDTAFGLLDESEATLAAISPSLVAAVSHPEVYVSMMAGDLDRAERHLRQGKRELQRLGERAVLASTEGYLAQVMLLAGRDAEADRAARRCARLATTADAGAQCAWRRVRARLLSAQGRHRQALTLAREAVQIVANTDHLNSQGDAMVDLAVVLAADGSQREAAEALATGVDRYRAKGNVVSATEAGSALSRPVVV